MERRFRRACLRGDGREAQRVVSAAAARLTCTHAAALAALAHHTFDDDASGSAVLYLAAGCHMRSQACAPSSSSGRRAWLGGGSASTDAGRAALLAWMLGVLADEQQQLDLSLINARGQGALHCCFVNGGSPCVLRVLLLQLPPGYPAPLRPCWQLEDAGGTTPLQLALALQDWRALTLMLAAGGGSAAASSDMAAAQQLLAALLPSAAGARAKAAGSGAGGAAVPPAGVALLTGVASRVLPAGWSAAMAAALDPSAPAAGAALPEAQGRRHQQQQHQQQQQLLQQEEQQQEQPCATSVEAAAVAEDGFGGRSSGVAVLPNAAAVVAQLQQAACGVACTAGVSESLALTLLAAHAYDADQATRAALQQKPVASGPSGSSSSSSSGDTGQRCIVCFETTACLHDPAAAAPSKAEASEEQPATSAAAAASSSNSSAITSWLSGWRKGGASSCSASTSSSNSSAGVPPHGRPAVASVQLPCGHVTCDDCWRGLTTACIEGLGMACLGCPQQGCGLLLPLSQLQRLAEEQVYQRCLQLLAQHAVDVSPHHRWCPAPGCGAAVALRSTEEGAALRRALAAGRAVDVQCRCCGCRFCWLCQGHAHEPASCQQVVSWRQLLQQLSATAETESTAWLLGNTQQCPRCGSRIQKAGGCNHVTCKVCRHEFCWVCLGDWQAHSANTGGFYACNRPAGGDTHTAEGAVAGLGDASAQLESSGGSSSTCQQQPQQGVMSVLGSVFSALKAAVLTHKQRHYLRLHASFELDPPKLQQLLLYQQGLLAMLLQQQDPQAAAGPAPGSPCSKDSPSQQQQQQQQAASTQLVQQLLQWQGFAALSAELADAWLACVTDCMHTLQHSCMLAFYSSSSAVLQLEHLQAQVSVRAQQLVAVVQQLPGAQQVLDHHAAAAAAAAAQRARSSRLTGGLRWAWQRLWQGLGYSSAAEGSQSSSSRSSGVAPAADAVALQRLQAGLPPQLLQQQVFYVLALSKMLPDIQQLLAAATQARWQLLQAARQGAFDAAGGGSGRIGGQAGSRGTAPWRGAAGAAAQQQQQQLTALDVICAGGSVHALREVVSEGLGHLKRTWQQQGQ